MSGAVQSANASGGHLVEEAQTLNELASLYVQRGRYAEAEGLYKRSLEIGEKMHGPDDPAVAASLNNIANLYGTLGRYADAGAALPAIPGDLREGARS